MDVDLIGWVGVGVGGTYGCRCGILYAPMLGVVLIRRFKIIVGLDYIIIVNLYNVLFTVSTQQYIITVIKYIQTGHITAQRLTKLIPS